MNALYLLAILAAAFCTALLIAFLRQRGSRSLKTRLRLVRGRSHLLSEEIERRLEALAAIDEEALAQAQQEATALLDLLQIQLVERQAHLQDGAELAHLQHLKIQVLEHQCRQVAALPELPPEQAPPPPDIPPSRDQLEDVLKQQIAALAPPKKKPKK